MRSSEVCSCAPLVVIGSANADIYVEIERLPKVGETVAASSGQTLPGGKGANQAACGARLSYPTYFVGQVGEDPHGSLIQDSLGACGVRLDHLNVVSAPTGHAVVMLQPGGQNSIIIVGGANVSWSGLEGGISPFTLGTQQLIRQAGVILLQREIPDFVNLEAAKIAKAAHVPIILDAGGMEGPILEDLLKCITVFSPNETELARLTGMPTETLEAVICAAKKCQEMGVGQVLVKLGEQGSVFLTEHGQLYMQPCVPAQNVVDTTGAGDTFTAAFAVALVEGQPLSDALQFAAAAASLCVQAKGAIPSMPERKAVVQLLQENSVIAKMQEQ
eukprot:c38933_g1_i1 orf=215-1207(+)